MFVILTFLGLHYLIISGSVSTGSLEIRCILACCQECRNSGFWQDIKTWGIPNT